MKSPIDLDLKGMEHRARIIALVDAYDAMTTDRVYRKAIRKEQTIEQIHRCAGTQFDPRLAELSIDLFYRPEYLLRKVRIDEEACSPRAWAGFAPIRIEKRRTRSGKHLHA